MESLAFRFSITLKGTNNFWHRKRLRNQKFRFYKLEARTLSRSVLGILWWVAVSAKLVTTQKSFFMKICPREFVHSVYDASLQWLYKFVVIVSSIFNEIFLVLQNQFKKIGYSSLRSYSCYYRCSIITYFKMIILIVYRISSRRYTFFSFKLLMLLQSLESSNLSRWRIKLYDWIL